VKVVEIVKGNNRSATSVATRDQQALQQATNKRPTSDQQATNKRPTRDQQY